MPEKKSLLPIGSIVIINGFEVDGAKKKLMIYGRKQIQSGNDEIWDYVACFYPEGNISSNYNVFFNHEDIARVLFRGYEDEEEIVYRDNFL